MRKILNKIALAICLLSGICSTLNAEERVKVFVHSLELSSNIDGAALLSSRFDDALFERLDRSNVVLPAREGSNVDESATGQSKGSALLKALVAGKTLYQQKKFNELVALLKPALQQFEEEAGSSDSFADYLEALAYLGAGYVSLGYGGDAKDVFRHLATLTGLARWSELPNLSDEFDQGVSKKYDKTAKKWLKKKKGKLKGTAASEGALASIDRGEPITLAAVNRLTLTRGRHRITCYAPNQTPTGHIWVKVKSGKTTDFDCKGQASSAANKAPVVDWDAFVRNLKLSPNDNQTIGEGRSTATKLNVEYIVIPFLRQSGEKFEIVGTLFSKQAGMTVRLGVFSFRLDISSALEQVEIVALSIEGSVKSFPYQNALIPGFLSKPSSRLTQGRLGASSAPVSKKKTKWHKSWWFWTTTAVVVGGLSTAGYLLLDGQSDSGEFDLEVTW